MRVDEDHSLDRLKNRQSAFAEEMAAFLILAGRLPGPASSGMFEMSEVPLIVRLVHRLDATTQSLFSVKEEAITVHQMLDDRRRMLDAIRILANTLSSNDAHSLDDLERQFGALPRQNLSPAIAPLADIFMLRPRKTVSKIALAQQLPWSKWLSGN